MIGENTFFESFFQYIREYSPDLNLMVLQTKLDSLFGDQLYVKKLPLNKYPFLIPLHWVTRLTSLPKIIDIEKVKKKS